MSNRTFDRETLLDLSVNVIPLAILAFFVIVYGVMGNYPDDPVVLVVQMSIIIVTGIALTLLTYFSGKAIAGSEEEDEIPPGYSAEDAAAAPDPEAESTAEDV
ncbi:hypothetical protein KY092_05960 [Natronomonas gomsonensis]|jgi:hypothetical protein|uniref:DUF6684 family protein n=1 Tax=Natronomonas gomsonensis TaxID=1046043 RepID=UPI0020CA6FB6|nr:DUF6684 family protein [Natronomonas gomsonensis]MCY4730100.1 hypothetical protein [Natronomonas gomsonensis]